MSSDTPITDDAQPEIMSAMALAESKYQEQVRRDLPRNYAANLVHGLLGQTGFRLVNAPTFLPAFIFILSGSHAAVGFALAAQHFGSALSSVFGATLIEHRKRVLPVGIIVGMGMRLQILGLALSGIFLPPQYALYAVAFFLMGLGLFSGMQGVLFNYLMSKVIPVELRGKLSGLRNFLAGLTASGVAYLGGKYFIETNFLGNGYGATFLLAFVLTTLGLVMLFFIKEPEPPAVRSQVHIMTRLGEIPDLLRADKAYTRFFLARGLAALGMMSVPFFAIYAGSKVGLSGANLGLFSVAFMLSSTTTNLVWGWIADRYGNRLVFLSAIIIWVLAIALLLMVEARPMFLVTFALLGTGMGGFQIGGQNLVLEFGNREDLPMRIAISNTAMSLMMGIGTLIAGLIATVSYTLLFSISIAVLSSSVAIVWFFVDEPRHRIISHEV
jgi:MFS family permease